MPFEEVTIPSVACCAFVSFASIMSKAVFPSRIGSAFRPDKLSRGDTPSLSALQEFLADSQLRRADLEMCCCNSNGV